MSKKMAASFNDTELRTTKYNEIVG